MSDGKYMYLAIPVDDQGPKGLGIVGPTVEAVEAAVQTIAQFGGGTTALSVYKVDSSMLQTTSVADRKLAGLIHN